MSVETRLGHERKEGDMGPECGRQWPRRAFGRGYEFLPALLVSIGWIPMPCAGEAGAKR